MAYQYDDLFQGIPYKVGWQNRSIGRLPIEPPHMDYANEQG